MPITAVFWPDNSATDIHLVPGYIGPRLDQLLWIEDTAGNRRADNPPAGVTVTFAGNFPVNSQTAGITVNRTTGEVEVSTALPPAPRLLDFLVIATVTEPGNPHSPFTAYRRYHIHEGITRIWLTPGELTVRQRARAMRPALLAEFTDGRYGSLNSWCPWEAPGTDRTYVRRSGETGPAIAWSSGNAASFGIDAQTGILNVSVSTGSATITADLARTPPLLGHSATGTVRAAPPWSTSTTLSHLGGPGFGAMADNPNILILADGFQASERGAAERLARQIVHRLGTRQRTRPFDLLRNRLNYFFAWTESPEGGTSPLHLVRRRNATAQVSDAEDVQVGVDPANVGTEFTIATPVTPATNDEFLLNERDTAFHVVMGERPAAMESAATHVCWLNPLRFNEEDLDDFLRALTDRGGTAVGDVWARGGKDEAHVVILTRTRAHGGANSPRENSGNYIVMTLGGELVHRMRDHPSSLGKALVPDRIPGVVGVEIWTLAAHELAHSFTIADEYGEGGTLPAVNAALLADFANAQPRDELLTGGVLDADRIKWRWPRLTRAGILETDIQDLGGGRYRVRLEGSQATAFPVGDVVRLRGRNLLSGPGPSDRLIVTAQADPELELELLGGSLTVASYRAGSLLITPKRATDPDAGNRVFGDDLELVHAGTRARINATRNPLNAAATDPPNRPCAGWLPTPTASTNWPDTNGDGRPDPPRPPRYSSWVVGLYENGDGFDCDVYRPTGVCLMRSQHYRDARGQDRAYQFCPVCRYAMVDLIDPTRHGAIDADYDPRYPT